MGETIAKQMGGEEGDWRGDENGMGWKGTAPA